MEGDTSSKEVAKGSAGLGATGLGAAGLGATGLGATGLGGLVNMGMTCYANAVIQCIRQCKKIPWICQHGNYTTLFEPADKVKEARKLKQSVMNSFAEVVQLLERCETKKSVRPAEFWRSVNPAVKGTMYEHLASREPHDSHEFYLFLLEAMHESTAVEVDMKILRPTPQTPEEHLVIRALESWKKEFTKEYSPFVDIFYGLGHWQTECQSCKTLTHRWESFNSLKVSVPAEKGGVKKLQDLLGVDMEPETIESYDCDTCKAKTTVKRWYRIWRLPHTVVLVLKRFNFDGQKIHTRVEPLERGEIDFAPYFSEQSPEREGVTTYHLRSIVDHHGSSQGGHYTAQVKQRGVEDWYFYDDEGVMHMEGKGPIYGDSTYMLFLERGEALTPSVAKEA